MPVHTCVAVRLKCRVYMSLGASFFFFFEDVLLVEFMYLVFTHIPDESYRGRLGSLLLYLCYVFRALIITNLKQNEAQVRT